MSEVVIVGGGASGLVTAIFAARAKHSVTILEHKDKLGKKILATGNGKCNYTNYNQRKEAYYSENREFPSKVLKIFDHKMAIDFFCELGILPKEKKGYVYPNSEQATSILEVLRLELERLKIKVLCNVHVEKIYKRGHEFCIITTEKEYVADKVVLATGGCASPNLGSDGSGYSLARNFGHHIIEPLPALVQLKSKENYFKTLGGVRSDVQLSLYLNNKMIQEEKGELLFTNYGVSGIVVFQVSRLASIGLFQKKKVDLLIDLMPFMDLEEVYQMLVSRLKFQPKRTIEENLIGVFHHKLSYIMLLEAGIEPKSKGSELSNNKLKEFAELIKNWKISIYDTQSFDQAQVTAGGVDTTEINPKTLESNLVEGLYMTGELLDVDGICGGYNLQWAWSTGAIAGKNIR